MRSDIFVVMGVSGCGKSTVGARLAAAGGLEYLEGDVLHSAHNVARMAAGFALSDADREGWLQTLAERIRQAREAGQGLVLSCSALKRSYRDILRQGAPDLYFLHLHGDSALLAARMAARTGHYMPLSLLASQLSTLEAPGVDENAQSFDVASPSEAIVAEVLARRAARSASTVQPFSGFTMAQVTKVILYTDNDGRAKFREEPVALSEGSPQARLTPVLPSTGYQLRHSPVGFRSQFHCTVTPQWVVILGGQMEIGLQQGESRIFQPGEHFYSADLLPPGAAFDAAVHGHWSRQVGPDPLVTLFVQG